MPTPIQEKAIPVALAGKDILGCAQTGTGKTASFAVPIIQLLHGRRKTKGKKAIEALILTPTRELALQISECIEEYACFTSIRHGVIFGGVNQRPQVELLNRGIDILVATPGRLLDLVNQGYIRLGEVKHFVLDGKDYYMDLLFYHRGLKRLVLVELKLGEFEPQDKGQVELYLRWLEKNERVEGEESPVALILCAEKSQETIELMQLDHGNIHVGQYMTQMPPKELLEQKLSLAIANARELLEQRKEE